VKEVFLEKWLVDAMIVCDACAGSGSCGDRYAGWISRSQRDLCPVSRCKWEAELSVT